MGSLTFQQFLEDIGHTLYSFLGFPSFPLLYSSSSWRVPINSLAASFQVIPPSTSIRGQGTADSPPTLTITYWVFLIHQPHPYSGSPNTPTTFIQDTQDSPPTPIPHPYWVSQFTTPYTNGAPRARPLHIKFPTRHPLPYGVPQLTYTHGAPKKEWRIGWSPSTFLRSANPMKNASTSKTKWGS